MVDLKLNIDVTSMLEPMQARKLLSELFNHHANLISLTMHAREKMKVRNLRMGDILNVLKAGKIINFPEFENGSYRYRVKTMKLTVVIAFKKPSHVVIVTAWREK